jgi:hypothetical protein
MRSQLEYMFAMVPGGTRLSVSDENRLPPSRSPLAGASVATFQPLLARVSYSAVASSRGRPDVCGWAGSNRYNSATRAGIFSLRSNKYGIHHRVQRKAE